MNMDIDPKKTNQQKILETYFKIFLKILEMQYYEFIMI